MDAQEMVFLKNTENNKEVRNKLNDNTSSDLENVSKELQIYSVKKTDFVNISYTREIVKSVVENSNSNSMDNQEHHISNNYEHELVHINTDNEINDNLSKKENFEQANITDKSTAECKKLYMNQSDLENNENIDIISFENPINANYIKQENVDNNDNFCNNSNNESIAKNITKKQIQHTSNIDEIHVNSSRKENSRSLSVKYKKMNVIDSDSEEDVKSSIADSNKSISETTIYPVDNQDFIPKYDRSHLLSFCDPDSSDEEVDNSEKQNSEEIIYELEKKTNKKSKLDSQDNSASRKLTGNDAIKLRKEIQSVSQKMTRESSLMLPYHKPKMRTLKEFLQSRPRFATAVPRSTCNTPPSLAIKMTNEQLKAISEKLSKREKEVEEFFRSESESGDDEEQTVECPENKTLEIIKNNEKVNELNKEEICSKNPSIVILQNVLLNPNFNTNDNKTQNIFEGKISKSVKEEDKVLNNVEQNNTDLINKKEIQKVDSDINIYEDHQNVSTIKKRFDVSNNANLPKFQISANEEEKSPANTSIENEKLNKLIEKYTSEEYTNETNSSIIEKNENNINENTNEQLTNITSILDLVKDFKPQLKGSPGLNINLEDGTTKLNEINQLMNRFLKHTKKKNPQKHKVKLDIVSVSGGEVHKEIVEMSVNEEEPIAINEKPGERLKKLRDELEAQIAQRRYELWQQKIKPKHFEEENENKCGEPDFIVKQNDILDNEDEEEFTDSEEDRESDTSQDNDYAIYKVKTKQKNSFVDEEAEESDIDIGIDKNDEDSLNEQEHEDADEEDNYETDINSDDGNDELLVDTLRKTPKKKKLKRIIIPFTNDSDDENSVSSVVEPKVEKSIANSNKECKSKEYVLDSTDTWDEYSGPTPYQPSSSCTPTRKQTQSKSELGFLTPVIQLTGLQSLNSGSKFLHESPVSPFVLPVDSSPIKSLTQNNTQKRLFIETDLATTQELSQVAALCSGKFSSQTQQTDQSDQCKGVFEVKEIISANHNYTNGEITSLAQNIPCTQDVEICSRKFTEITQVSRKDVEEVKNEKSTFRSNYSENNKPVLNLTEISINNNEVKSLDTEDKLISQLLDEEEMENFKKKFDSPLSNNFSSTVPINRIIYDSSDEENNISNKMKKSQRKLNFSDDSDDDENQEEYVENNYEIGLHDVDKEFEDDIPINVEYDSEENEIEINSEGNMKKFEIADFLENEAELSESEWGSEDEDERGLDKFEEEEGDIENIDENKVKRDLERIHMRRILDDDNQEVRILQELLLDDGDLHGSGREKQFRWKNMDSIGNDEDESHKEDGEIYLDDEDENEEKWRKMRYEREIFLKKQLERSENLSTEEENSLVNTNSQVFKLGQAAIKRCRSNFYNSTMQKMKMPLSDPEIKEPVSLLSKRGSFLTRSDHVLTRVAEFTKTLTTTVGNAKNSRNFVFQRVAEPDENTLNKKRKTDDNTPVAIKKLRLTNFNSASHKKQKKERSTSKKLFSMW